LKERTEEGGEAGNRKRGKRGGSPLVEVTVNSKEETLKDFGPNYVLESGLCTGKKINYGKALFDDQSELSDNLRFIVSKQVGLLNCS
jgi:hypothetical protein